MENLPPVSIYVITYLKSEERSEVLRRTCESALAQNYPEFEVVVSDNGGPISAHDALVSIGDPRLKVFRHTENVGFGGNMNRCVELCSHEIIKPLCDDDLIHPDFLKCTVPYVDDDSLVMGEAEKYLFGSDPVGMADEVRETCPAERRPAGYGRDQWALSYAPFPSAVIFTRKLFKDLGGYDPKTITSDWDFFIEACIYKSIVHINPTLCYGGVWSGSLTEEMVARPFFFPFEGLYTKFRIFHSKNLGADERRWLRTMLWKEWMLQSLRPLRHPFKARYWQGYREYTCRFFKFLHYRKDVFSPRPN